MSIERDLVIRPLIGVGPVEFSMTRDEVLSRLGRPAREEPRRDLFFGATFQVVYLTDGTVESVQVARRSRFSPTLYDVPVLALPAHEVISRLVRHAPANTAGSDFPYTCDFPSIEVGLWRPEDPDAPRDARFDAVMASVAGVVSRR